MTPAHPFHPVIWGIFLSTNKTIPPADVFCRIVVCSIQNHVHAAKPAPKLFVFFQMERLIPILLNWARVCSAGAAFWIAGWIKLHMD